MMKEIEISVPIGREPSSEQITAAAAKAMGVAPKAVASYRIVRRSIDARGDILYRYRIEAYKAGEDLNEYRLPEYRDVSQAEPVTVIGAGPAGMFAALHLLMRGFRPVILERGKDVHARKFDMARLSREGIVDPDSNYCFGEGGAGTFSDGKLFTRSSKRGDIREVLHQLVTFGADPSILIDAHPHIGSDRLPAIVENIRHCIISHGGEYHFGTRVTDIRKMEDGGFDVVAGSRTFSSRKVILATGHSARDIYNLFAEKGWELQAKGFALGVRVEHPQSLINRIQYHGKYQPYMPAAEYSFVTQIEGRGVFSFCMCPGGILVPSATGPGETVLNGMSNSARNSRWANAGVVVSVEPEDIQEYSRYGALSLLHFQMDVEKRMYDFTGSIKAPAQRMMDFCRRTPSSGLPATSYHPGAVNAPLHELLPEHVSLRLKYAFPEIGNKKMKGYYTNEALLLGVESRTSSPVRIPRDPDTLEHTQLKGLYPCGEGAGYSGGIVSSALDGIRCAEMV
ncbi:MAG: NAD(P)/FAD-dependent oxidoreductase [Bacteroidetes bacterium]|uniref:NAD(P)/FAD-dependent oxidoreductase n=1 Tax=Candidatus Cryptobacteroides merdavium TaxID=2840769 RepID=A0A9D9ECU0_9BACT|nr:NAD(P)/FAD-dependent oxidoreductase [Candidatus Cryptobacteroides merdavium]